MTSDSSACSQPAPRATVVLVVEDEVLVRFALAEYLREYGFKIYEARNADEAVELLSFYKGQIDVVFSDVKMPGHIDGIGLASWIKKNRPGLPVILTSGELRLALDAMLQGRFLGKPYDLKNVLALIEDAAKDRTVDGERN